MLGVLPGTGGLTRLTDKRGVRRDLADVFATTAEGVRGQRAVDWRLVDEIAKPTEFDAAARTLAERAIADATPAPGRPASAGSSCHPCPVKQPKTAGGTSMCSSSLTAVPPTATLTITGPAAPPSAMAELHEAGAAAWPLAAARELDDAISRLRFGEPELGTWLLKTTGDPAAVLATDAILAAADDWLATGDHRAVEADAAQARGDQPVADRADRTWQLLCRHPARVRARRRPAVHA